MVFRRFENIKGYAFGDARLFVDGVEEAKKKLREEKSVDCRRYAGERHTWSHLKTMSSSCWVNCRCCEGLSDKGGTSRPSMVARISFHNLVITITIAASVRVCFIIAKLSSKYWNNGLSANVISTSDGGGCVA